MRSDFCNKSRSKRYKACSDVVRVVGGEPTRIASQEPKGDVTPVTNNNSMNRHSSVSLQQSADVVPVGKGVRL